MAWVCGSLPWAPLEKRGKSCYNTTSDDGFTDRLPCHVRLGGTILNQMSLRLLALFLLVSLLLSGGNPAAAVETDPNAALPLEDGLT